MKNVLILGASGAIATLVTRNLLDDSRVRLTLLVRHPDRLADDIRYDSRVTIVVADVVKDTAKLTATLQGQDLVYANLYGANLKQQGQAVVAAMTAAGVSRIIWISANGIYNEIPGKYGQWNA